MFSLDHWMILVFHTPDCMYSNLNIATHENLRRQEVPAILKPTSLTMPHLLLRPHFITFWHLFLININWLVSVWVYALCLSHMIGCFDICSQWLCRCTDVVSESTLCARCTEYISPYCLCPGLCLQLEAWSTARKIISQYYSSYTWAHRQRWSLEKYDLPSTTCHSAQLSIPGSLVWGAVILRGPLFLLNTVCIAILYFVFKCRRILLSLPFFFILFPAPFYESCLTKNCQHTKD